jgi:hypothetical protein
MLKPVYEVHILVIVLQAVVVLKQVRFASEVEQLEIRVVAVGLLAEVVVRIAVQEHLCILFLVQEDRAF